MKNETTLKKALYVLLYDQFDCDQFDCYDQLDCSDVSLCDEILEGCIISALIEKNGSTCPFKNYSSEELCKSHTKECLKGDSKISCDKDEHDIWKSFIKQH